MSNPSDPTWGGTSGDGQQTPPGWPTSPPPSSPAPGPYGANPYGQPPAYGQPAYGPPSYGQGPYGQGPYGPPGPYGMGGYGAGPIEHPQGTTVLILGILGFVVCGFLGVAAFFMGNRVIKEIDANPGRYSNRGSVQVGRILGGIVTVLMILGIVAVIILVAVGATQGSSSVN